MKSSATYRPEKILVVSLQGIGNSILALPMLADLKVHFSQARITLLVADKQQADLFNCVDPVDESIFMTRRRMIPGLLRRLRRKNFDLGLVSFPHGRTSVLLAWAAGCKRLVGHVDGRLHRTGGIFFKKRVPVDRGLHDIEQNRNLLRAIDIPVGNDHRCSLTLPEKALRRAAELAPEDRRIMAVHPGCNPRFPEKCWPARRYGELAITLARQLDLQTIVLAGPGEKQLARQVVENSDGKAQIIDEPLDLVATAALLSRCRLFVGNDSGMMNLAVLMKVPTIGLFGPSESRRTGPSGPNSKALVSVLDCSPCWELAPWDGCRYDTVRCLEEIQTEAVAAAAVDLLAEADMD